MKFFLAFSLVSSLIISVGLYASDQENLKLQVEMMKKKIKQLEDEKKKSNSSSSGGLKVKDYGNSSMGQTNTTSSTNSNQQISPEQMKKLQDAMKNGKKYLEERNEFLQELENEE
jgi:hypothetical protein